MAFVRLDPFYRNPVYVELPCVVIYSKDGIAFLHPEYELIQITPDKPIPDTGDKPIFSKVLNSIKLFDGIVVGMHRPDSKTDKELLKAFTPKPIAAKVAKNIWEYLKVILTPEFKLDYALQLAEAGIVSDIVNIQTDIEPRFVHSEPYSEGFNEVVVDVKVENQNNRAMLIVKAGKKELKFDNASGSHVLMVPSIFKLDHSEMRECALPPNIHLYTSLVWQWRGYQFDI